MGSQNTELEAGLGASAFLEVEMQSQGKESERKREVRQQRRKSKCRPATDSRGRKAACLLMKDVCG